MRRQTIIMISLVLILLPFMTGCDFLAGLMSLACFINPDSDHCFQAAGIQGNDPSECEKIQGEKFKDLGSNPPRDKCYLEIAQNTGDFDICSNIRGGPMSYTKEECILGTAIQNENPSGCKMLSGQSRTECRQTLGTKIGAEKVVEVDDQIDIIKDALKDDPDDAELKKQLQGLETKRKDMIDVLTPVNQKEYELMSDKTGRMIAADYKSGEIDADTKADLIAMNEQLKKNGGKLDAEAYAKVKEYYTFLNDPANDIEQMDDAKLAKDRWDDKLGNAVDYMKFWKTKDSKTEQAYDEQLRFYERMLARQEAIAKMQSELMQDIDRNAGIVVDTAGNYVADKAQEAIIKAVFGEATEKTVGITTAVIGEALDSVQGYAKSAEFRGLVRAYNKGMEEELAKSKGDVEKAHAAVVKQLYTNSYEYEDQNTFAKYGNVLENKDCDGSNPHCIKHDVFWKAMKKSYQYQHP